MPQWFDPMKESHEGRLLAQVLALEKQLKGEEKLDESKADRNKDGEISSWERKVGEAIEANMKGKGKGDKQAGETDRGCPHVRFGPEPCDKCKAKDTKKGFDTTSQILSDMGIVKYEVEGNLQNGVPQFMDVAGGEPTRATVYSTNHRVPQFTDGPSKTTVNEVFKMPSVAQTGYDTSASSLHMHLNDGGNSGNLPNLAPIEDSLASLKKSIGVGQMGIAEEITSLLEQVYSRL